MSKRYGRNQKRKHLEEIRQLSEAQEFSVGERKLAQYTRSKLEEKNALIADMIKIISNVCRNSVALPPENRKETIIYDPYRMPRQNRLPAFVDYNAMEPVDFCFKTVDLYKLETYLTEHPDFTKAVHLTFGDDRHSVYRISELGLASMTEEKLMKQIVPKIALGLIRHLRGNYDGSRTY